MEMVKAINLKVLKKAHENKWVALSANYQKVLATEETLQSLRQKVGRQDVIVMRVLPSDVGYAPRTIA